MKERRRGKMRKRRRKRKKYHHNEMGKDESLKGKKTEVENMIEVQEKGKGEEAEKEKALRSKTKWGRTNH